MGFGERRTTASPHTTWHHLVCCNMAGEETDCASTRHGQACDGMMIACGGGGLQEQHHMANVHAKEHSQRWSDPSLAPSSLGVAVCSFQVVRKIGHARSVTENIRETLASIFRSTLLLSKGNLNIKSEYLHNIKRLLENENRFPLPSSIIDVVVLASRNERRWNNAYEYRYARLQRWWRAFPTPIYHKVPAWFVGRWRLLQDLHRIHQRNSRWMHQLS